MWFDAAKNLAPPRADTYTHATCVKHHKLNFHIPMAEFMNQPTSAALYHRIARISLFRYIVCAVWCRVVGCWSHCYFGGLVELILILYMCVVRWLFAKCASWKRGFYGRQISVWRHIELELTLFTIICAYVQKGDWCACCAYILLTSSSWLWVAIINQMPNETGLSRHDKYHSFLRCSKTPYEDHFNEIIIIGQSARVIEATN